MTLFQAVKKAGIKYSNHYSDLYIPASAITRKLLKEYGEHGTQFINQVEGGLWFDIFAAYDPFWEGK